MIVTPTKEMIQEMIDVIVREADPVAVVMFGSQAGGGMRPGSDVDLLIVEEKPFGNGRDRRKEMTRLWRALAHFPVAKDILVFSREEVERRRTARNDVVAQALREGKVLYGSI